MAATSLRLLRVVRSRFFLLHRCRLPLFPLCRRLLTCRLLTLALLRLNSAEDRRGVQMIVLVTPPRPGHHHVAHVPVRRRLAVGQPAVPHAEVEHHRASSGRQQRRVRGPPLGLPGGLPPAEAGASAAGEELGSESEEEDDPLGLKTLDVLAVVRSVHSESSIVLTTMGGVRGWKGADVATFAHINCLNREYEDTKAKIERIIFDYSRYGSVVGPAHNLLHRACDREGSYHGGGGMALRSAHAGALREDQARHLP